MTHDTRRGPMTEREIVETEIRLRKMFNVRGRAK